MAKLLLLVSGLLLLASSGLGYLNLNRLKTTQEAARQAVQSARTGADRADKVGRDLKANQQQLDAANQNAADLQTKLAGATQAAAAAKAAADENAAKAAALQTDLDQARANLAKVPPAPLAVPENAERDTKIRDLEAQLAEARLLQQNLQAQAKNAADSMRELRAREQRRAAGQMASGLTGSVRAVDHNWNFVVLDLGDRQGVVNNAEMVVTRGGSLVGKVRITSVEPGQSIADIIPNSVPPGISVERGDRVVYTGGEPVRR